MLEQTDLTALEKDASVIDEHEFAPILSKNMRDAIAELHELRTLCQEQQKTMSEIRKMINVTVIEHEKVAVQILNHLEKLRKPL